MGPSTPQYGSIEVRTSLFMRIIEQFRPRGYRWIQHPGRINGGDSVVHLERESTNRKDPNAIRVVCGGQSCGWVPREVAAYLAGVIDSGRLVTVRVLDVGGDNDDLEIEISPLLHGYNILSLL